MPKSKLKSNHGGHALSRGKGSVYQRSATKRREGREHAEMLTVFPLLTSDREEAAPRPA